MAYPILDFVNPEYDADFTRAVYVLDTDEIETAMAKAISTYKECSSACLTDETNALLVRLFNMTLKYFREYPNSTKGLLPRSEVGALFGAFQREIRSLVNEASRLWEGPDWEVICKKIAVQILFKILVDSECPISSDILVNTYQIPLRSLVNSAKLLIKAGLISQYMVDGEVHYTPTAKGIIFRYSETFRSLVGESAKLLYL